VARIGHIYVKNRSDQIHTITGGQVNKAAAPIDAL